MVDSKENDTFDMGVKGFRDRSSPEGGEGVAEYFSGDHVVFTGKRRGNKSSLKEENMEHTEPYG